MLAGKENSQKKFQLYVAQQRKIPINKEELENIGASFTREELKELAESVPVSEKQQIEQGMRRQKELQKEELSQEVES